MKIPFSPPFIDEDVINEVVDALKSGWITTGPKVKALEEQIVKLSGAQSALCVNSWTSGAIMMLTWLGVKEGDEVIIPAYTYAATALAVIHAGAKPVMVDINDDFNISVEEIAKAITNKTKAIIPVDIAGWPCDYKQIMDLVRYKEIIEKFTPSSDVQKKLGRILVLNDAAHSLGAKYFNKNIGTECDVTIFSLHAVKNVTTAEGGVICLNMPDVFDNVKLYSELRIMTLNCQTKDAFSKSKAGGWRYDIVGLGMKINLADVNAAIGLAQIRKYDILLSKRKEIAAKYRKAFSEYDWVVLPHQISDVKESSYHIFPLRIKNASEEQRDNIIQKISDADVAVNVHFIPLPMLNYFKGKGYDINDFPQSFKNYSTEISLPIYPQLTNEQIDYIVSAVVNAYNSEK